MQYLITAINAVFPAFFIILLGVFARLKNWINQEEVQRFNRISFNIFTPCMCFYNLYNADLGSDCNPSLLLFCGLGIFLCWCVSAAVATLVEKDLEKRGILLMSFYLSNIILLGIPIVENIYGSAATSKTAVIISMVVPINNTLAVLSMELFRSKKVPPREIIKGIVTNPLIIACALGLIVNLLHIPLPSALRTGLSNASKMASVLMLFLIGGFFRTEFITENLRDISVSAVFRLLLVPFAALCCAVLLGFRGIELLIILVTFASPSGVMIFTMANRMNGDLKLASTMIMVSSAFSCVTLTLWLTLLMRLQLI